MWVRVEELKQVELNLPIDVPLREVCVEVRGLNGPEEGLVHDLQMRPGELQNGLVLL